MPCAIVALLFLLLHFLVFWPNGLTRSRPMVFVIIHVPWPISKGFRSFLFTYLCLLASMLYACVSLSSSRLCYVWCPSRAWPCVVTSDSHEALFRCNHLGGISRCWVAPCIPFPFPLCTMLCLPCLFVPPLAFYASLYACLHVHAWVLLASVSSILQHNEVVDIQSKPTFVPPRTPPFVWLLSRLLVCLPPCLFAF